MGKILEIVITDDDIRQLAEELEADPDEAIKVAEEWAEHIERTAGDLIARQFSSVVETGNP